MNNAASATLIWGKKGGEKRHLELLIRFHSVKHIYSTYTKNKITLGEFNNKRNKAHIAAFEEADSALRSAQDIIRELGITFTFEAFKERYLIRVRGCYASNSDLGYVVDLFLNDTDRAYPLSAGTKSDYRTAMNWVYRFKAKIKVSDINKSFVNRFEIFMLETNPNLSKNTRNIYLRALKAVYNYAVRKGLVVDQKPFAGRNLASTRKQNYGLEEEDFLKIVQYHSDDYQEMLGRDFFILSFQLGGNYLSDILRLKNKNLELTSKGYRLTFVRKKTQKANKPINLLLTDAAIDLLNKYGRVGLDSPTHYILPYLSDSLTEAQANDRVGDLAYKINAGLAMVCKKLNMQKVTLSQARHTYATIGRDNGLMDRDIQNDLGHTDIRTTIGYMNSVTTKSLNTSRDFRERFS